MVLLLEYNIFVLFPPLPCIDSNATDMFKAQKGCKDNVKIVHVTSVVDHKYLNLCSEDDRRTYLRLWNNMRVSNS